MCILSLVEHCDLIYSVYVYIKIHDSCCCNQLTPHAMSLLFKSVDNLCIYEAREWTRWQLKNRLTLISKFILILLIYCPENGARHIVASLVIFVPIIWQIGLIGTEPWSGHDILTWNRPCMLPAFHKMNEDHMRRTCSNPNQLRLRKRSIMTLLGQMKSWLHHFKLAPPKS